MLLTRSQGNCNTCSTRIASFCLLLVGWLLRTRVGQPSKARGERATYGNARPGGGTGRRSSRTHTASEYEGPGLRVPVTQSEIHLRWFSFSRKNTRQRPPPGGDPHSRSTRGVGSGKGPSPGPGPAKRASPQRGRASTGEEEKGKITVSCSSQFASGSTKARNYATAVLSRQPLANSFGLREGAGASSAPAALPSVAPPAACPPPARDRVVRQRLAS